MRAGSLDLFGVCYYLPHMDIQNEGLKKSKQVIVLRKDLNMRKGKMVSQGAHASLKAILDLMEDNHGNFKYISTQGKTGEHTYHLYSQGGSPLDDWLKGKFTKITVSVNSELELIELYEKAKSNGLICSLITDAGLTEFNGIPTKTAIAIGPGWSEDIDSLTGHLPLL